MLPQKTLWQVEFLQTTKFLKVSSSCLLSTNCTVLKICCCTGLVKKSRIPNLCSHFNNEKLWNEIKIARLCLAAIANSLLIRVLCIVFYALCQYIIFYAEFPIISSSPITLEEPVWVSDEPKGCLNNSCIEANWDSLIEEASLFSNNWGSLSVEAA